MRIRVDWAHQAIDDLKHLPHWQLAETATRAVRRLAEERIAFVLHVVVDDGPDEFRLLIPRVRTYVLIRRSDAALYVERVIYRR